MIAVTLLAGALIGANGVAILRGRRAPSMALQGFAWAWFALGFMVITASVQAALGLLPEPSIPVYRTILWLRALASAVAIGGFGAYILYVWTGSLRVSAIAVAVAVAHAFWWMMFVNTYDITALTVGRWGVQPTYTPEIHLPGGAAGAVAIFFLPLAELVVGYLVFWPRASGGAQRFRVLAVSLAIILFMAGLGVLVNPNFSPDDPILAVNLVVVLMSGLVARLAFAPPAWARRRFGLQRYPD